ncbi:MAG: hypothetical protein AAGA85_22235 [Bacteroidota bacterium]
MNTRIALIMVCMAGLLVGALAQTKVEERIPVSGQRELDLDLPFARDIELKTWDKSEVFVEVQVSINDGEDDDLYELEVSSSGGSIYVEANKDLDRKGGRKRNCWNMEIFYVIYFPESLEVEAESISGSYSMVYYGKPANFKTISGDVDLTVPGREGIDFQVKTISGEVYSDLEIVYPNGKDGLRQLVGTDVSGEVNGGGEFLDLETISGNIFLRKG